MKEPKNKLKIVNDPVYGFINIPNELVFDVIEHPYFQRLRRINQMGLSNMVYPGARHTRFHHSLGCMHLMQMTVKSLKAKGVEILEQEEQGLYLSILLHDIGHGPFSHTMEGIIVEGVAHEDISLMFMEKLNQEFGGKLSLAIEIFKKQYHKSFMNELVSSQLDIDRLDYLKRDSFYTGVTEGNINSERIIEMLNVRGGSLVVEEKGIYSIEKFLVGRRLMYWLVYMHKTGVVAERMLINIFNRAKELIGEGKKIKLSQRLSYFMTGEYDFENNADESIERFSRLDDYDIISAVKDWCDCPDRVISTLSKMLLGRDLLKVKIYKSPVEKEKLASMEEKVMAHFNIDREHIHYFVFKVELSNTAYDNSPGKEIKILRKNNKIEDVIKVADENVLNGYSNKVVKYCMCYPEVIDR